MQTQKEFAKELKKVVNKLMGEEYKVEIHCTEKVNVETLHALVIVNSDRAVSPTFYIEDLYKDYLQKRITVQEIAEYIVHAYNSHTSLPVKENELKACLNDSTWMKERLFLKLINSDKNKGLLNNSIYMDFQEFALILYIMVSNDENGVAQIRVTTKICEHFGWNEKNILNYAMENTVQLFPYKEIPLYNLVQESADSIGVPLNTDIPDIPEMTIITNNRCIHGAIVVFYPNVLKNIAEKRGTSLFLFPSSIHEFIILEDDGIFNPEELAEMVKEVNISAVSPEDVLSDNVYYYGHDSGILSVLKNGKPKKIAVL